ncbi:MAG: hypothetical protein ACI90V_009338 [Bacillariaceae sp.]|jgi:hypothetical protein
MQTFICEFSLVLQTEMQYFPERFGFIFCEGTQAHQDDETNVDNGTGFQFACKKYGQKR